MQEMHFKPPDQARQPTFASEKPDGDGREETVEIIPINRDIPDNCIAAGVPARVLRKLDEQDRMNVWDTYMKNEVPLSQRERERYKRKPTTELRYL